MSVSVALFGIYKHSSLLYSSVSDEEKEFRNTDTLTQFYKTFFLFTAATEKYNPRRNF
jgi:hypothetical protein